MLHSCFSSLTLFLIVNRSVFKMTEILTPVDYSHVWPIFAQMHTTVFSTPTWQTQKCYTDCHSLYFVVTDFSPLCPRRRLQNNWQAPAPAPAAATFSSETVDTPRLAPAGTVRPRLRHWPVQSQSTMELLSYYSPAVGSEPSWKTLAWL